MNQQCDFCGNLFLGRSYKRPDYLARRFCSVTCVEAFEAQVGLPSGRIYEARPGWSAFPLVRPEQRALPC